MIEARQSFMGGLDLDTNYFQIRKDCYLDARNITRDAVSASQDMAISKVVGNQKVDYTLPAGTCQVIGAEEDTLRNRVLYFVYNSNDRDSILSYNRSTNTISKVLENITDTGGEDLLQFDVNKKILHVEVVHREEGDILYWTDGNVSPKGFLIDKVANGTYGTVELDFIKAAKNQPKTIPVAGYEDDTSKNNNSLRRKLFRFKFRWVYDDFSRSTWSSISEVPLPVGVVGTDADMQPTKNNVINVSVATGNKNVTGIEIAAQNNIDNIWGDFYQIAFLDKVILGIADNATYDYDFYNDGVYPDIDQRESNLLFDWFPLLAKSMVLANGNVLVYGAITEGYDLLGQNNMEIEMTVANVTNTGVDLGAPLITYTGGSGSFTFTITGSVPTGTYYRVVAFITSLGTAIILSEYTSLPGDSTADVAQGLYDSTSPSYRSTVGGNQYICIFGGYIVQIYAIPGSGSSSIATASTYNWNDKLLFGIAYFDDEGRTPGVETFVNQGGGDNDFEINTPNFSQSGGVPQTPVISASINHTPPSWATSYVWVRTKSLTFARFLYYITNDFQSDADYYYLGVENVRYFYSLNNRFNYSQVSAADGDRVKVLGVGSTGNYTSSIYNDDYEVLGIERRQLTGGASTDMGDFLKVKRPVSAPSPAYVSSMFIMVYTPARTAINENLNVFYEFGPRYEIYEDGGNRYHRGEQQDQTASQPATFQFTNGNIYYHQRTVYTNVILTTKNTWLMPDENYNDFYRSAVNGDGRPQVIDVNAKQSYYPATLRFGQEFQPDTNINDLNRFYRENFKDYNREYGSILKMRVRDQYIKVGQEFKIGAIPVELQIIKTATGDDQVTVSDTLLNPIRYFSGEFGIGTAPESWASFNFSDYGVDNNRGVIWRLSQDGLTPISILYKVNSWATDKLPQRTGNSKIYGGYDVKSNNYIIALEAAGDDPADTINFDEESNSFESFLDLKPEMMVTLGTILIAFKNGELWTHDSALYNNFFGVQYDATVKPIVLGNPLQKKNFVSISEVASDVWDIPSIETNVNSYGSTKQQSNLIESDLVLEDGDWNASFLRDSNSIGGILDGDKLNGNYLILQFRNSGSDQAALNIFSVKYTDNALTNT